MTTSSIVRTLSTLTAASALVFGLAACGSDSVDNSSEGSSSAAVPSVSSSATAGSDKDDKDNEDSKDAKKSESEKSSDSGSSNSGGRSEPQPEDGAVEQVEEVPQAGGRTEEDQQYLSALKDGGIDLKKSGDDRSGLEDSLIAAGVSYCRAQENDQEDVLLPLAAGQLKSIGVVDGEPQETEKVLVDAAKSAYCQ